MVEGQTVVRENEVSRPASNGCTINHVVASVTKMVLEAALLYLDLSRSPAWIHAPSHRHVILGKNPLFGYFPKSFSNGTYSPAIRRRTRVVL